VERLGRPKIDALLSDTMVDLCYAQGAGNALHEALRGEWQKREKYSTLSYWEATGNALTLGGANDNNDRR
jgi:hypothetical protein